MKKLLYILSFLAIIPQATAHITTIFIDIDAVFQTDNMRAASYIGKINSIRYLSKVGNLPNQEDLFKQLKNIKAQSTQVTYHNNLEMPLILSDWLTTIQSTNHILEKINQHFYADKISDIEVKVLTAIINMMLNPHSLADTQKIRPKMDSFLQKLHQYNYKIYIVGNWAHINTLKSAFPEIFQYIKGTFVSGNLHMLKPSINYYQQVLTSSGCNIEESLWIEHEPKFFSALQKMHYNVVKYNDHQDLIAQLKKYNVII